MALKSGLIFFCHVFQKQLQKLLSVFKNAILNCHFLSACLFFTSLICCLLWADNLLLCFPPVVQNWPAGPVLRGTVPASYTCLVCAREHTLWNDILRMCVPLIRAVKCTSIISKALLTVGCEHSCFSVWHYFS